MAVIWDYGIYAPYGYSSQYFDNSRFHTGEDWATRGATNIPVTVNGVTIGIAGTTGASDGIHTHVGRWAGGKHTPPNGGGRILGDDAIVTEIDTTGYTDNGKFVRVRSGGVDWVYLHLAQVNVKVGDRLQQQGAAPVVDKNLLINYYQTLFGRYPDADALKPGAYIGRPADVVFQELILSDEYIARRDGTVNRIKQLEASEQKLAQDVVDRDNVIKDLKAQGIGDKVRIGTINDKPVYGDK